MNFWTSIFISSLKTLPFGQLSLTLPDGKNYNFSGYQKGPSAQLKIKNYDSIKKIMKNGSIGFAEEFVANNISTNNLSALIYYFALNNDFIEKTLLYSLTFKIFNFLNHFWNNNSKIGSKNNIKKHYDIGNSFYQKWLDPSMTYSSAIFNKNNKNLFSAQKNKYDKILNLAEVKNGDNILEIGCGWGGLLEHASKKYNCKITGTTISNAQFEFVKKKLNKLKTNQVNVINQDYRDLTGKFDKIISIEMFEAVGEKYWNIYFKKIRNLIKKDGIISIQLITIKDEAFKYYKKNPDFIQKYIFPGGMLPSFEILEKIISKNSLKIKSVNSYANDYSQTLKIWRNNFINSYHTLEKFGFDDNFYRLWNFYLAYCEGGFKSKRVDLKQLKIVVN